MIRSALPLSLAAALGLSACGSDPNTMSSRQPAPRAAAAAPAAATLPYWAGNGVVQSVTAAPRIATAGATKAPVTTTRTEPVSSASASATTSAATGASATTYHRLGIRMDDGKMQYVDMAGADIPTVGTRVQLTPDHQIIRQQ